MDKNYLENILKYWTLRKRKAISGFSLRFLWQDDFPITYQRTITFEFSVWALVFGIHENKPK